MKKNLKLAFAFFVLILPFFSHAQNKPQINANITGKVLESKTSERVVGATVSIKGTTNGAITDANGEFTLITGQKLPFTLIISSIGYIKQELVINTSDVEIRLDEEVNQLGDIVVTSRRRNESVQEIPIPISVIRGVTAEDAGAFTPNRLKELLPSVQLYSSNGRNTTLNIRGLGSTFGLTNDGIDPGVGFYVDGVYYARPAASVIDFVDIDRIEVLRGPQGTLYGKNTTAGTFNITSRAPSFTPTASFESSYGNLNYIQSKASISGPISKKIAARLSFSGTQRDGTIFNTTTQKPTNSLNNLGIRGQILFQPNDKFDISIFGDNNRQRPDGNATVYAGVVTTKRAAYRQFNAIIKDLGYSLPSTNPFDRITDTDTPWKVNNDLGGASININAKIGRGKLTSTSAWRYWKWDPSNDRDFTGLPVLTKSQGNSKHQQLSQEVRYSGQFLEKLSGVLGVFYIKQDLQSDPVQVEESGPAQWRFSQSSTSALWKTPGLLNGFGTKTTSSLKSTGAAVFGQADWAIVEGLHLLPGIRYNYDKKDVDYKRETYGGLATTDPALLAIKNGIYTNQAFQFGVEEYNFSGQVTLAFKPTQKFHAFATFANSYKPVGVNLGGLPTANGQVLLDLAKVKPEKVQHAEIGIKAKPSIYSNINFVVFDTEIKDYQTQVQTAEVGVNRGYLANAEKVRVKGAELDGNVKVGKQITFSGALSYTDGRYIKFTNAPVPLEEVGGTSAFKDISGGVLPGISKWAGSVSTEIIQKGNLASLKGNFFTSADLYFRSSFSSSPSPSQYLNIDGYSLLNLRVGFRAANGLSAILWSRNLANTEYFEQLLPAAGSAGHYAAVLGDPRTYGITLRYVF